MAQDLINKLPVGDPQTILRALAEYAQKFSLWSIDRFEVTILLRSGHTLSAKAARMGRDLDGDCVLLYQGDEKDPALVYLRLADVVAVRINDPSVAARAFSERAQKARSGAAPTRLETKRAIEKRNEELKQSGTLPLIGCLWDTLGETPEEQFNIADVLEALPRVLIEIAKDPLGAQALRRVASVTVRGAAGTGLRATKDGSSIEVSCDFRRAQADPLDTDLRAALELVL